MDRTEVYKVIDSERNYHEAQAKKWDHKGNPTVEAEILMMEEYMRKVRTAWVEHHNDETSLDMMRKVIAMGVRCLENHGTGVEKLSRNESGETEDESEHN